MRVVHITLDVYNTNSPRKVSLVGQSWGLGIAVIEKTLYHALRIFWAPGSAWRGSIKSVRLSVCTSVRRCVMYFYQEVFSQTMFQN